MKYFLYALVDPNDKVIMSMKKMYDEGSNVKAIAKYFNESYVYVWRVIKNKRSTK